MNIFDWTKSYNEDSFCPVSKQEADPNPLILIDHLAGEKRFAGWTDSGGQQWLAHVYMGNDVLFKLTENERSSRRDPLFWQLRAGRVIIRRWTCFFFLTVLLLTTGNELDMTTQWLHCWSAPGNVSACLCDWRRKSY